MRFPSSAALAAVSLMLAAASAPADDAPHRGRIFGKGYPFALEDLPRGRLRDGIDRLRGPARWRALNWLHRFRFHERDAAYLEVDTEGGVFYTERPLDAAQVAAAAAVTAQAEAVTTLASAAADDVFGLHSRPGSPNVVFIDFDGHVITGTAWNRNTFDPFVARPFDLDGNPASFSATEREAIAEIWHRVAEDFAPFDIDVTTEEPAFFNSTTGRILITSETDANGRAMPSSSGGGVAYVDVWDGFRYDYYSPALVFYDNLANHPAYIAESAAHEFGHNLGLDHDGIGNDAYYDGHGTGDTSWGPIMGSPFNKNVTQWSKGEYSGADNTDQDDIFEIASRLGLIGDDHGDLPATATSLRLEADGEVLVSDPETDPHNAFPANKGVVETIDDWDYFVFESGPGTLDLTVNPAWQAFFRTSRRGANLDVRAVLLNAAGAQVAVSDPGTLTHATINTSVAAGTYYLGVTGVGSASYTSYGSQGQYFVSGNVPLPAPNLAPSAGFSSACQGVDCSFVNAATDPDGSVVAWAWDFGDGSSASVPSPTHRYATPGTYTVTLTVTDDDGATDQHSQPLVLFRIVASAAGPLLQTGFSDGAGNEYAVLFNLGTVSLSSASIQAVIDLALAAPTLLDLGTSGSGSWGSIRLIRVDPPIAAQPTIAAAAGIAPPLAQLETLAGPLQDAPTGPAPTGRPPRPGTLGRGQPASNAIAVTPETSTSPPPIGSWHARAASAAPLTVEPGATLYADVYLDPADTPRELTLRWRGRSDSGAAYWGDADAAAAARPHLGNLPAAGRWVRLQTPAAALGLQGRTRIAVQLVAAGGTVRLGRVGIMP